MKKRKIQIALVELCCHQEVLFSLLNLLNELPFEVWIYTTDNILEAAKLTDHSNFGHWIVKSRKESAGKFLQKNEKAIVQADLVFFLTVTNNWSSYLAISQKCPSLLVVHNVNYLLNPSKNVCLDTFFNEGKLLMKSKMFFNLCFLHKKKARKALLKAQQALLLLSESSLNYLSQQYLGKSKLVLLPYPYYDPEIVPDACFENELIIVLPGGLYPEYKDYDIIKMLLKDLKENQLSQKIRFVFLGAIDSKAGQLFSEEIEAFCCEQLQIVCFKTRVFESEFASWMSQAAFMVLPLKRKVLYGIIEEQYGLSKISGGVNDMIRFGIPAFLPSFYPIAPSLEELVWRFDANNFIERFRKVVQEKVFLKKRHIAKSILAHAYPKQKQLIALNNLISSFVNGK